MSFGGSSGGGGHAPKSNTYIPQHIQTADQGAWAGIQSIAGNNPYLQNQPQYQQILSGYMNNPYYSQALQGSQAGGTALTNSANQTLQYLPQLQSMISPGATAAGSILNTAFDPQQALYDRTQNQLANQVGAQLAGSGIGTSGAGAGVMNDALTNFNIDWQNNQLNRESAGLGAYTSGLGSLGSIASGLTGLGSQAGAQLQAGGAMPYSFFSSNLGQQQGALDAYGQSVGMGGDQILQQATSDALGYLGQGIGAQGQAYDQQMARYQAALQQGQNQAAGFGSLLGTGLNLAGGALGGIGAGADGGYSFLPLLASMGSAW